MDGTKEFWAKETRLIPFTMAGHLQCFWFGFCQLRFKQLLNCLLTNATKTRKNCLEILTDRLNWTALLSTEYLCGGLIMFQVF